MYRVLCDGLPIHDLRDEELVLLDPQLDLEVNTAGSFSFKLPPGHPQYDLPKKMRSCIEVWHDNEQIFAGRPTVDKLDFYNRKNIECEGQLAFLNDSIQRPAEYHNMTVRGYLETLIAIHNSQVDESRQFEVGIVTVTDSNDSLYRYTNYNSTWKEVKEDLIDDLGGYIRVRNHNGHRYIDYIAEFDNLCSQSIEFGENLLDCVREVDMTDIATAVIPLGARLEESEIAALEERLTIKSVNDGLDYIVNEEAVAEYGFIVKTVTWDDVTTPEMLLYKGKKWLTDEQFESMVIDVKAVDLHYTDEQIEQFKLFDMVPVHSSPHGLNRNFPLSKMKVYIDKPSSNTFQLGTTVRITLTSMVSEAQSSLQKVVETIPVPSSIVQQAIEQATALITAATRGHVVTTANEQLIMDTADVNTATRVWRWNLNGFGYSNTGYNGTYKTAITMDGWIVGERIAANSISGDKLDITYRTSVTKEIADAEEQARSDAEGYTDEKLKNYYTMSQIEASIRTLENSVLLSAKETAEQYVDGKLKSYSTTAQIKVTTDAISSEVSKKVGTNNVISAINQSSENITIKAGKISLEGTVTANGNFKILTNGSIEATGGKFKGTIEGSTITGSNLVFKSSDGSTDYISLTQMGLMVDGQKAPSGLTKGGYFMFSTTWGWFLNCTSPILYKPSKDSSEQWFAVFAQSCNKFRFVWNVTGTSYLEIQTLTGAWGITAWYSDVSMKENIQPATLNGISEIMKIPHYSFDWKDKTLHSDCGYIAQDMKEINSNYVLALAQKDKDGKATGKVVYQIDETNLIPVITKALQEVIEKVNKLEERMG